jgi:magnesium transporter
MPELGQKWGYPLVWLVMIIIAAGMMYFFKKKKWF